MVSFQQIEAALSSFKPEKLSDDSLKRGAVIVPIFQRAGKLYLLFTKRTEELPIHKGQIVFPGGKLEEKDQSLLACALREAWEEIGVPSSKIEILGELNQIKITTSNFLLSAFVGKLEPPFELKINHNEVQEVIEIPLDQFLDKKNWESKRIEANRKKPIHWFFYYKDKIVWGATAKLVKQLVDLL